MTTKPMLEIEEAPAVQFPRRISVALTEEHFRKLQELKAQRKNTAKFLRTAIHEALNSVPASKKTG